jgi:hypothetical protein
MVTDFKIDGVSHEVDFGDAVFSVGGSQVLSNAESDIAYGQDWYEQGFKVLDFLEPIEFTALFNGVTRCVEELVGAKGFQLDKYHQYVQDDETHYKVVEMTRNLFPEDFDFPLWEMLQNLETLFGFPLSDIDPDTGKKLHMVLRINRPHSNDFNPPHKDIYQALDEYAEIPKIVNLWIPIAGVSSQSMLPVAPGSHLLPESKILRTLDGGRMNGNQYRVRNVKRWGGGNEMQRPTIQYGQVLAFSPFIVHGCAVNNQEDATRVSLECRLFQSQS